MENKKDALIINLFGGPGAGKSTTAGGVFTILKMHDVECELVLEYAKDLVWEERHKTFKDQQYLFAKQNHRLWRVRDRVDVAITDCPLMVSPVYGKKYNTGSKAFNENVICVTKGYNNLNIVLTRTQKYNPNGRNENEDQAKEIDTLIEKVLDDNGMPFTKVGTNFEGINSIAELILKDLGKTLLFKFTKEAQ